MNIYAHLVARLGQPASNAIVILARAALIALVILFGDKGFTTFAYLQL